MFFLAGREEPFLEFFLGCLFGVFSKVLWCPVNFGRKSNVESCLSSFLFSFFAVNVLLARFGWPHNFRP